MDQYSVERGSTPFCSLHFFDCLSTRSEDAQRRFSVYPSVKRETNVLYQQPHLVEPMMLRVYEDLPATPTSPEPSQLSQWGRNLASRASSRASRMSTKRTATTKTMISRPQPIPETSTEPPLRRRREFTPLQLSIYGNSNRLSDLPQFDRFSFTDGGELKLPPKVLVRTQSETILRKHQDLTIDPPKRTASMFEAGEVIVARPETSYSIISTSRPPSEYDALHSHPVSWASLPSITVPKSQKPDNVVSVLTPMQEEFSPITAVTVDGTVLNFPKSVQSASNTTDLDLSSTSESPAPYPTVHRGPSCAASIRPKPVRQASHSSFQTQKRISQWLQYRTQSNSTSTIGSFSTTASFAEHRRKRSEFYKLGQLQEQGQSHYHAQSPATKSSSLAAAIASPPPTTYLPSPPTVVPSTPPTMPQHNRTDTSSTTHTTDTSILSSTFDHESSSSSTPASRTSEDSMTTTHSTPELKSRTGTVKSISHSGLRIVTPDRRRDMNGLEGFVGFSVPVLSARSPTDDDEVYLDEINGPLRSPGVGIAF